MNKYLRACLISLAFCGLLLATPKAMAATDFTITSPTMAIGAGTPSRAMSLTIVGGPVAGSAATFTLSDGGAGGTFYPSTVSIPANADPGSSTQFIYIASSNASGTITIQASASGGITTTHNLRLPIGVATRFVSDTFSGAAGSALAGRVPNIGSAWTLVDNSGLLLSLNGSGGVYTTSTGHTYSEYIVPTSVPQQEHDLCESVSNFNANTFLPGGITAFGANSASINGYRFVYGGSWVLLRFVSNSGVSIVNSTASPVTAGGSANMCLSVRVINSLQYIIALVNGAMIGAVQDGTITSGYPAIIPEVNAGQTASASDSVQSNFYGANVDWSVSSSLAIVSPGSLPANHPGNITVTLSGSSTSWVDGVTNFTVSGVSGVTKVSQHVANATSATVVVTTGTSTGNLMISDGPNNAHMNVGTPSISVSPSSGASGTSTITLTGVNTVWTQENASGLFSISGGTGASLATPTISSDTVATAVLTIGTGTGPITIADNSTGATTIFTPARIVTFPNANVYQSPYGWISSGTTVIAPTGGASLKFTVTGTQSISVNVDTTVNNGLAAGDMPTIKVSMTTATTTTSSSTWVQFPASNTSNVLLNLASGLNASATYNVTLSMIGGTQGATPGYNGVNFATKINSLQLDTSAVLNAPTLRSNSCMFWGDSILESYFGGQNTGYPSGTYPDIVDYTQAWPSYVASTTLNCEYTQTGVGSQGWINPGQGNYPAFGSSWNHYNSVTPITFSTSTPLTYAVIDEGTNDHGQATSTIAANVKSTLTAMRSAFGSTTIIFLVTPYNPTFDDGTGAPRLGVIAGYNAYEASSSDSRAYLIDLGTTAQQYALSPWSNDNIHPDIAAHAQIAPLIEAGMTPDLPAMAASPSTMSFGTTGNIVTLTGTSTAWNAGTPGTPTFTLSGGSGASITAQTITNATSATLTINTGTATGTLIITDPYSAATTTITVTASTSTAPQALTATAGNAQVALSWSAPTSNGGSPLTQYLIYDRFTGSSTFALCATTTASQTTSMMTSLMNGQSYDFEIVAQNTVGTSSASNIASSTPALPTAILQVTTSTSLNFSAPHGSAATSSQSGKIANTGPMSSTFTWSATSTQSWLTFSSTSGTLAGGASTSILLIANPSGLATGLYTATATIMAPGATGSPITLGSSFLISSTGINAVILSPSSGSTVTSTVTISASVTSTAGITSVQFLLDGSSLGTVTSTPYSLSWNSNTASNATHTLSVLATDALGNIASGTLSLTVDNMTPTLLITAPSSGATVSGITSITASATDTLSSVVSVVFFVDGSPIGTATSSPYTISWDTMQVSNGSHVVSAIATDGVGNTTSTALSVAVTNTITSTPSTTIVEVGGGGTYGPYLPYYSRVTSSTVPDNSPGAISTSTLEATIMNLTAELQQLLFEANTDNTAIVGSTSTPSITFSTDLKIGASGREVTMLQEYLNAHGFFVALSGSGAPGRETAIFGNKTLQALIAFQKASDIQPASGYFGPITRAYVNNGK